MTSKDSSAVFILVVWFDKKKWFKNVSTYIIKNFYAGNICMLIQ